MMRRILVFSLFVFLCSCSGRTEQDVFVFDPSKDYPEFPLSLTDVADVRFVKFGGEEEDIYYSTFWDSGMCIDDTNNKIIASHWNLGVVEFDMDGNFLRRIGRLGRGPGEYQTTFFYVNPDDERVGVVDISQEKIMVFNYEGTFLKDEEMKVRIMPASFNTFQVLNGSLIVYNPGSSVFDEDQGRVYSRSKRTLELIPLTGKKRDEIKDIHYEKPLVRPRQWPGGGNGIMMNGYLIPSYSGLLMSTYRCDTTYVIDKDFSWKPFLVNTRHNGVQEGCLYPVAETRDYLFLCHKNNLRDAKMFYFAIDKRTKQAYKITEDESNPLPGCLQGKIQIRNEGLTKTSEYRFWEFHSFELMEYYDYLPPELKVLVDQCDESSNPIYMIIKFKTVAR